MIIKTYNIGGVKSVNNTYNLNLTSDDIAEIKLRHNNYKNNRYVSDYYFYPYSLKLRPSVKKIMPKLVY